MATPRISRIDGLFNTYANTTVTYLDAVDAGTGISNYARLGLTVAQRNGWATRKNTWNDKYALWGNVALRTKPITAAKNNAKKDFIVFVQPLVNFIAGRPDLLENDYAAFNIKKRDTEPTARPVITTFPYPELVTIGGGKVRVVVRVQNDKNRASMQKDADAIEMVYTIGLTPPSGPEDTAEKDSYKRSLRIFDFGVENRNQNLYAFFRWKNETDAAKTGPWSTMVQTVIS